MEQKTVFLSYRRASSKHLARSIYQDLKMHGWDVFLDVNTIDSGDFDRIILNQIGARAHFVLLISPGALERCQHADDWVLREIQEAVRLDRNIVPVVEEGADFSREMSYLPADLREIVSKKNALPLPHFFFDAALEMLRTRFLKTPETIRVTEAPAAERTEIQRRIAQIEQVPPVRALPQLPAPFEWITIPGKRYAIAKYPITNAQFAPFIEAGGYRTRKWWTKTGLQVREQEKWNEPRYWRDTSWNAADRPVVGISWYEALAFCQWLSEQSSVQIALPTGEQWQFAAQGEDARVYPWGQSWDPARANHDVDGRGQGRTSAVSKYAQKGASPFGVADLAGNVWEWCRDDFETGSIDVESAATYRTVRGGSYMSKDRDQLRCDARKSLRPLVWDTTCGFRIVAAEGR